MSSHATWLGVFSGVCIAALESQASARDGGFFLHERWLESGRCGTPFGVPCWDPAGEEPPEPKFEDPGSVLRALWSALPERPVVYPSEQYYYFRCMIRDRAVAGNIRFVDAAKGLLHVGYYDINDQSKTVSRSFGVADGVLVRTSGNGGSNVEVRAFGRTMLFTLDRSWDCTPRPGMVLDHERVISGIRDESGYYFVLVYCDAKAKFYYLLNDDFDAPERLVTVLDDPRLSIGQHSRFVFFRDSLAGRTILVGVSAREIRLNSYFDGPFDQVPPDLDIREELETAYPYVRMRGGIDVHGNFDRLEGQRVAISPYAQYERVEEFAQILARTTDGGGEWLSLVDEPKRYFHLSPAFDAYASGDESSTQEHQTERSRSWPAMHFPVRSDLWPTVHARAASVAWPPHHEPRSSRLLGEVSSETTDGPR